MLYPPSFEPEGAAGLVRSAMEPRNMTTLNLAYVAMAVILCAALNLVAAGCGREETSRCGPSRAEFDAVTKSQRETQAALAAVNKAIRDIRNCVDSQGARVGEQAFDVIELERKLTELTARCNGVYTALLNMSQWREKIEQDITQHDQQLTEMMTRHDQQLAEMRTSLQAIQDGILREQESAARLGTQPQVELNQLTARVRELESQIKSLRENIHFLTTRLQQTENSIAVLSARVSPPVIKASCSDVELRYTEDVEEENGQLNIAVQGTLTNTAQGIIPLVVLVVRVKRANGYSASGQRLYWLLPRIKKEIEYRNLRPGEDRLVLIKIPYKHNQPVGQAVRWTVELEVEKKVYN